MTNQSGDTNVFRAGPKFELLATNSVGEYSNSTLAASDGAIFCARTRVSGALPSDHRAWLSAWPSWT